LEVIGCPSVVFLVVVVLSVLLRFTAFDYPFGGIFKLFNDEATEPMLPCGLVESIA
jgi:hypothetical protein